MIYDMKECSKIMGKRIRQLRTKVYLKTQEEFVEMVNGYLNRKQLLDDEGKFTRNIMARLEAKDDITSTRLYHLLNFLYDTKCINPAWVILERNLSHAPYLRKVPGNIDLFALKKDIREYQRRIDERLETIMHFYGLGL